MLEHPLETKKIALKKKKSVPFLFALQNGNNSQSQEILAHSSPKKSSEDVRAEIQESCKQSPVCPGMQNWKDINYKLRCKLIQIQIKIQIGFVTVSQNRSQDVVRRVNGLSKLFQLSMKTNPKHQTLLTQQGAGFGFKKVIFNLLHSASSGSL